MVRSVLYLSLRLGLSPVVKMKLQSRLSYQAWSVWLSLRRASSRILRLTEMRIAKWQNSEIMRPIVQNPLSMQMKAYVSVENKAFK